MSSNRLVLQLTYALFAFAAVTGSPSRPNRGKDIKVLDDDDSKTEPALTNSYFDPQEDCLYDPLPPDVSFLYYTEKYPSGKYLEFQSLVSTGMHKSAFTKILTHGMRSNLSSPEMLGLIKAYLNSTDQINVLALDWSSYTMGMYRETVAEAIRIGKLAASIFCVLYKNFDIYPYQMHFIGHGVGAHLLATTARESKTRIGRLTGLDPARLCFEDYCYGLHYPQLTKNDADFVDVLHTDAGNIGVGHSHGTADFYVNYGKHQPKCHVLYKLSSPYCDSLTSIIYYTESIREPFKYFASPCSTPYPTLSCNTEPSVVWGEYMGGAARGIYNFYSNSSSSFA